MLLIEEHHVVGICESVAGENVLTDIVLKVVDVIGVVKAQKLLFFSSTDLVYIKLSVEVEALNKRVCHGHALGLHWMVLVVVELADFIVVEISHSPPTHY